MKAIKSLIIVLTVLIYAPQVHAQVHIIEQQGMSFSPSHLEVHVGDTIRWLWSSGTHTTTSVNIPSGANSWNHPLTQSDTSFDYIVQVPGTYNYHCTPHAPGMAGSFEVLLTTGTGQQNFLPVERDVKIYPNPAREHVHVYMASRPDRCLIRVNDIIGNLVKEQFCNTSSETKMFVGDLSDGLYFLRITDGADIISEQRIIVTN